MPKNPLSDLDEILAKSQRLTAKFNDAGTSFRYLNRGVGLMKLLYLIMQLLNWIFFPVISKATELGEASRLLAEGNDARNSRVASDDSRSRNFFNEVNAISLKVIAILYFYLLQVHIIYPYRLMKNLFNHQALIWPVIWLIIMIWLLWMLFKKQDKHLILFYLICKEGIFSYILSNKGLHII